MRNNRPQFHFGSPSGHVGHRLNLIFSPAGGKVSSHMPAPVRTCFFSPAGSKVAPVVSYVCYGYPVDYHRSHHTTLMLLPVGCLVGFPHLLGSGRSLHAAPLPVVG